MCVAWCCLAIWLGHRNHKEDGIHTHGEAVLFINTATHTHTPLTPRQGCCTQPQRNRPRAPWDQLAQQPAICAPLSVPRPVT